jgi:4-alpha-glucanotransferase
VADAEQRDLVWRVAFCPERQHYYFFSIDETRGVARQWVHPRGGDVLFHVDIYVAEPAQATGN